MKLIRSVIALMLIALSSPYFLHPAARAAASREDEPTNVAEEGPGISAARAAAMGTAPRPPFRAPVNGWLSFVIQGDGHPPIPYTCDSQELLRRAIEGSNLGAVAGHPHIFYLTPAWAEKVETGGSVRPLPLYYVVEGDDALNINYCEDQTLMRSAARSSRLGLVPGQTQVFYVTSEWAGRLEKAAFTYSLSYFYVVVEGDSPLDMWCCDNQKLVKMIINESRLGPVPGAAPNVFFVNRKWKSSLDEAEAQLVNLRISCPGEDILEKLWYCDDQRLVREAIQESHFGRIADGIANTYYVTPEWRERIGAKSFTPWIWWAKGDSDRHTCFSHKRLVLEAGQDSGCLRGCIGSYSLSPAWTKKLLAEAKAVNCSEIKEANEAAILKLASLHGAVGTAGVVAYKTWKYLFA